jgi:hypothetical protein
VSNGVFSPIKNLEMSSTLVAPLWRNSIKDW